MRNIYGAGRCQSIPWCRNLQLDVEGNLMRFTALLPVCAIASVVAITLTGGGAAVAASADVRQMMAARVVLQEPELGQLIDASRSAAKSLTELGLTEADFYRADEIDQDWIAAAAEEAFAQAGIDALTSRSVVGQSAAGRCSAGAQIAYADHIASVNAGRDRAARSQAEETVYMWLSHFSPSGSIASTTPCMRAAPTPRPRDSGSTKTSGVHPPLQQISDPDDRATSDACGFVY